MEMNIAKLMYHKWEEEPISGIARGHIGTFAIFFYGCNMKCIYCQNSKISHSIVVANANAANCVHSDDAVGAKHCEPDCWGNSKKIIYTPSELSELMIKAQNENAATISFITGVLYIDKIAETIKLAKAKGLTIPIVYNSSGYEPVSQIKKLDGLIDIYLPDFKYYDNDLGNKLSRVNNYPSVAKKCIAEMYRQVVGANNNAAHIVRGDDALGASSASPRCRELRERQNERADTIRPSMGELCEPASVGADTIRTGEQREPKLIIRHLVLPGHTENSKQVIKYLYDTYGDDICISIMSQYTPMPNNDGITAFPELMRKLTKREYEKVVSYAIDIGVKNAFIQEGDVAKESFIPEFL
jgi:putative pyruvate formate lyase activating enzyme